MFFMKTSQELSRIFILSMIACIISIAVCFAEKLEVKGRYAPVRKYKDGKGEVAGVLRKGDVVKVLEKSGNWYKVTLEKRNITGWIHKDLLVAAGKPKPKPKTKTKTKAKIKTKTVKKKPKPTPPSKASKMGSAGVMPFSVNGVSETDGNAITSAFRNELRARNKFNIMEQEEMRNLLEQKGFQLSEVCSEVECYVYVGQTIGVDNIITGQATKIGEVISLAVRVIDVKTGRVIRVALEDTDLSVNSLIKKVLPKFAKNLGGKASVGRRVFDIKGGDEQHLLAVLKLEANGITDAEAQGFANRLRTEFFNTNKFTVMEQERMVNILDEQGFKKSKSCTDASCLVEVGQLTGVKYMVGGNIAKIGNSYAISARLIDVGTGKTVSTATEYTNAELGSILRFTMTDISRGLAGLKIYSRRNLPRNISIAAASALAVSGGIFLYLAENTFKEYDKERLDTELIEQYRSKYLVQSYTSIGCFSLAGVGAASAVFFHIKRKSKLYVLNSLAFVPHLDGKGITLVKRF
jgi:curli biogenesis system outer membrane secretion channel CsgG